MKFTQKKISFLCMIAAPQYVVKIFLPLSSNLDTLLISFLLLILGRGIFPIKFAALVASFNCPWMVFDAF